MLKPTQTIFYGEIEGALLEADFYQSIDHHRHKTIIYIHGGGLIYGSRDDLPKEYVKLFLENGYNFLAIDYPLCPESKLNDILHSCEQALDWFTNHAVRELNLHSNEYILFGRSSGGFLSNYLTARYKGKKPLKLISLYSYFSLEHPGLSLPNPHYQSLTAIPAQIVERSIQANPLTSGSIHKRYSIYMYYRQKGEWISNLLDSGSSAGNYSLSDDELAKFPPTFLAVSNHDQDVPPEMTYHLAKVIPQTMCYKVSNQVHDFDRDTQKTESSILYQSIIHWLSL
ncbi:alpha/beta hydrolase [Brevibacillus sp. SYSU BS000544]|uniref:alpha/beta hydrolase n=1 Tax=Brevibacillus sp. SYSU BS000544 TaxID=3416443 RepID=UPI003CE46EF6